jgi:Domain of unknown function (DUF4349)
MQRRVFVILVVAAAIGIVAVAASLSLGRPGAYATAASDTSGVTFGAADGGRDARLSTPLAPPAPAMEEVRALGGTASSKGTSWAGEPAPTSEPALGAVSSQAQQAGSMLIRSGHATVEVDSVEAGIARVRRLAEETGALIANTSVQAGRERQRSASLELRVPAQRFDAVVSGLAPIGKVESVNITAQDVGEEFVDLTARLANARRLEARLLELLANRAGRLTDVLTVERELARVREQIERYEGRLRYLQTRAAVSSLTVVVHEPAPVVATHPGEDVIADAFVEAWRRFVRLTAGFIASLGVLVPLGAIAFGAFVLGRRYLPRKLFATEQV